MVIKIRLNRNLNIIKRDVVAAKILIKYLKNLSFPFDRYFLKSTETKCDFCDAKMN